MLHVMIPIGLFCLWMVHPSCIRGLSLRQRHRSDEGRIQYSRQQERLSKGHVLPAAGSCIRVDPEVMIVKGRAPADNEMAAVTVYPGIAGDGMGIHLHNS